MGFRVDLVAWIDGGGKSVGEVRKTL